MNVAVNSCCVCRAVFTLWVGGWQARAMGGCGGTVPVQCCRSLAGLVRSFVRVLCVRSLSGFSL